MSEYRYAERQFLTWYAQNGGDASAAARAEMLVRLNGLRQLCAKGKLEAGIDWCRDFLESDGKLVVFAHHKPVQRAITEALSDFNPRVVAAESSIAEREQAIADFQTDDSVRVIVCSLLAGSVGITLTAASNVCFFELGWTPKDMLQAVDRCHRIGQRDAVTGWQLIHVDTIDAFMAELLAEKREIMEQVLDGHAAADTGDQSIVN